MLTDRWRKATPKIWFVLGKDHHLDRRRLHVKHVRILIRTLGLEQCKPSATPYCQESEDTFVQDGHELSEHEIRTHRGNAACVVYLTQDRMDLSVCGCLLASSVANPKGSDQARLKRVGRYLKGRPSYRQLYRWDEATQITLQTDSDWATCQNTTIAKWWHSFRGLSSSSALVWAPTANGTSVRRS